LPVRLTQIAEPNLLPAKFLWRVAMEVERPAPASRVEPQAVAVQAPLEAGDVGEGGGDSD
jgi:hypothetical protein